MISTANFRNGLVLRLEGELMEIAEFQHVNPGKGAAFVRTKLKNLMTGRVLEKTFRAGEKVEDVRVEGQTWQYLYNDGELFHFMHPESYDQIAVNGDTVGDCAKWMKENENITLMFEGQNVLKVEVPQHVNLVITESDPGIQGDRTSGATKPATLETGAVIQVPLFLKEGDTVRVDTRTGGYLSRA